MDSEPSRKGNGNASLGDGYQEPHMALARLPKAGDDSRRNHIVSAIEDRNEPCTDCVIRNGDPDVQLCPLSCAPAHPRARPFIGHSLDTDREVYSKSLKSLALPRGIEPLFQP